MDFSRLIVVVAFFRNRSKANRKRRAAYSGLESGEKKEIEIKLRCASGRCEMKIITRNDTLKHRDTVADAADDHQHF